MHYTLLRVHVALIYGLDFKYIHLETWHAPLKPDQRYLQCMWTNCANPSFVYVRSCGCPTDNDTAGGCEYHGYVPVCSYHVFSELRQIETEIKMHYATISDFRFALSA